MAAAACLLPTHIPDRGIAMPTAVILPSNPFASLIAEPVTSDLRARRRFFAFFQKWRTWLFRAIDRSQPGNRDLVRRGVDDLLALTILVQFVRDRKIDAISSLEQLAGHLNDSTIGRLCEELQDASSCSVLKAVFDPTHFAGECVLPAVVMERAFWNPLIKASRTIYGSPLPVTIFGDLHQWSLAFTPDELPGRQQGPRRETRRYDKGVHYTPALSSIT
jgi:hypothetical protein